MDIAPGLEAELEHVVGEPDTAEVLGSGDIAVLGTPKVVALCEQAAVEALSSALEESQTSVGVRIDLEHLAPTPVGRRVVAKARLEAVDPRSLTFSVEAFDDAGIVARGTHVRVVVERERFLRGAEERA